MKAGGIELIDEIPEVGGVAESNVEDKYSFAEDLEKLKYREKLNAVLTLEHTLIKERTMLWQRQVYAFLLLTLSCVWLWFIGNFLWHFGEVTVLPKIPGTIVPEIRPVSDSVLIALITTTTLNVLGLFYIVARWLFPQTESESEKKSS